MKVIPSKNIEMTTELSYQEVRKILNNHIRPKNRSRYRFKKQNKGEVFEGFFEHDEFKIQRIIKGRNSFLPQIKGKIQPYQNGTKLTASLKIHTTVIIFMVFWLVFVGFAFVMGIFGTINQGINPVLLIIPLIMLAFGIELTHFGFHLERENSINDLKRIINAQ